MNRNRLMAALLVAALPLAGCGNKGPLIRVPNVEGGPPEMPAADTTVMPADNGSIVLPAESGTVMPPSASTVPDIDNDDGSTGTPR
ncbi:lipoprotein [Lysobacter sp. A6]|uniref:Lipoprotein n=1 Tax=Noviluteimonas lactosilytica TaxID=2888523 RepID=A0ABS8JH16_9GAMM|nr:lipoprotein [Lysobacter lactosilyticus]MCC8362898.1 lipoprotein [Lysobacter lactosilyticus]